METHAFFERTATCRCLPISAARPEPRIASAIRACGRAFRARWPRPPRACISTQALLAALAARGIERASLTLHVGAGTFAPVRDRASGAAQDAQRALRDPGRRHALRSSAPRAGRARRGRRHHRGTRARVGRAVRRRGRGCAAAAARGETALFIRPGFRFRVVDALLTNFHLPQSTLLMLVAAFAGRAQVLAAYAHAVAARYRFFSYGDAMLVWPTAPRSDGVMTAHRPQRCSSSCWRATARRAAGGCTCRAARSRRRRSCRSVPTARSRAMTPAGARGAGRADRSRQYLSSDAAAGAGDRGAAPCRSARFHGLAAPDPDRLGRLPGIQSGDLAPDR